MNNQFVSDAARGIARRVSQSSVESKARLVRAFELLFGREPTSEEQIMAAEFMGQEPDEATLSLYIHGLLMTNEFAFVD